MDENIYGLMKFYIFYVWKNLTRTTAAHIEGKKEKKSCLSTEVYFMKTKHTK